MMSCFKSEEIERYWRSIEALDPMIKYLGLKKRLQLARINSDLQSMVHGWLRWHQQQLNIITKLNHDHAMQFRPSCTLKVNLDSGHLPSGFLGHFPRLQSLNFIHSADIPALVSTIEHLIGDFTAAEKMESSGFQKIDEMGYKHLMAAMEFKSSLKTIGLDVLGEEGKSVKSYEIERGSGLVSSKNIDLTLDIGIIEIHNVRERIWLSSHWRTPDQLRQYLTSQALSALEVLGFRLNEMWPMSDEGLESFCEAFRESTCDRLNTFILDIYAGVPQYQTLMLLESISNRWPDLKHLNIYCGNILRDQEISQIIQWFTKLETLSIKNFMSQPIKYQAPFPPANFLKQLSLQPLRLTTLTSFPSLRMWTIERLDVEDLHRLALIQSGLPQSNLETLYLKTLDFQQRAGYKSMNKAFIGFRQLLRSCPKLKSLQILSLDLESSSLIHRLCGIITNECSNLENLTLKNTGIGLFRPLHFNKMISRLKHMAVAPLEFNFESFQFLINNSPKLRSLGLPSKSEAACEDGFQFLIQLRHQHDPDFVVYDWCSN